MLHVEQWHSTPKCHVETILRTQNVPRGAFSVKVVRPKLKRMLLEKTKCHLYFVSDERKQRIDVLHVWDGRRERLPAL